MDDEKNYKWVCVENLEQEDGSRRKVFIKENNDEKDYDKIIADFENNAADEIVDFLEAISEVEYKLYNLKGKIAYRKAYYLLNTDWKQLNEERAKEDLPRISNQAMKDAYIASMIDDLQSEYDTLKVKYHYLNELWKYRLRHGKISD